MQWYNKLKQTTLEVEAPLIKVEIENVDRQINRAETELTWQDQTCWNYICTLNDTVYQLERRLQKTKDNVEMMEVLMNGWSKQPMFCRKDHKKESTLQLDDRAGRVAKTYNNLRKDAEAIHNLLQVRKSFLYSRLFSLHPFSLTCFLVSFPGEHDPFCSG